MVDTKDIVFVNYILDNVHGFIGLTKLEDQIERLPIFKRLQDISQLGLVKRIFPGALHNRYIHSLGVMFVIDQMALHLKEFSPAERQLLRLAGMLHDLGHYPLSHDLEQVYEIADSVLDYETSSVREVLVDEIKEDIEKITRIDLKLMPDDKDIADKVIKPKKELVKKISLYHHESITAHVIRSSASIKDIIISGITEGYFNEEDSDWTEGKSIEEVTDFAEKIVADICALIQGDGDYVYENGAFPKHFTAMIQLLHSELDADRIDYLLRDATFSGASYGSFDVGLLMQNLRMREYKIGSKTVWIVGVREKGIGCADQYMVNRYLAYTQVIFHKYTSIIGKMLKEVVLWLMKLPGSDFYNPDAVIKIIKNHENSTKYFEFTDSYFFEKLNAIRKDEDGCPEDIYCFVEQLKRYRSLELECEDVFSGNLLHQQSHIEESDFYKHVLELEQKGEADKEDAVYLFNSKKITNHVPIEQFKKNFDLYNSTHQQKLNYDEFSRDRLMDGLAVIKDDTPVLLIDAPGSMMREMYDIQQVMLRRYTLPINSK